MPIVGKLTAIEQTLLEHLEDLVLSPVVPVSWPDQDYTPTEGQPYLVPSFLPNQTDRGGITINAPRRHVGLFQVLVKGVLGEGPVPNSEIADSVIEHFADQGLVAHGVLVRIGSYDGGPDLPWRTAALRQDVTSDIPVTIPWWCDTP